MNDIQQEIKTALMNRGVVFDLSSKSFENPTKEKSILRLFSGVNFPVDASFYKECLSMAMHTISSYNDKEHLWEYIEELFLKELNLSNKNFGFYTECSGTDAAKSLYKQLFGNLDRTILCVGNHDHQNVIGASYCATNKVVISIESLEYNGVWNVRSYSWFKELEKLLLSGAYDKLIINIVGTDTILGERLPDSFFAELKKEAQCIISENNLDVDLYFIIDSVWEMFQLPRDYTLVDFSFMTSHALTLPDGFGLVLYNKKHQKVLSANIAEHNTPYDCVIVLASYYYIKRIKMFHQSFYYGLEKVISTFSDWLKYKVGYTLKRVRTNYYLDTSPSVLGVKIYNDSGREVPLHLFRPFKAPKPIHEAYGQGSIFRISSKDILESERRLYEILYFIYLICYNDKVGNYGNY